MPASPNIIDMPSPLTNGHVPLQAPLAVKESAAVRLARLHQPQYAQAIEAYQGRFCLLDYFFSNHRMIVAALESGASQRQIYRWACEEFEPRISCQYSHFAATLRRFRRLLGIPSARERVKNIAAQLRSMAVPVQPTHAGSDLQTVSKSETAPPETPSTPLCVPVPASPPDVPNVLRTEGLDAASSAPPTPDQARALVSPTVEQSPVESRRAETPEPQVASTATKISSSPPPVPVAPRLGTITNLGGSADFVRNMRADMQIQSYSTSEERMQALMRARELRVQQELADELTLRGRNPPVV